MDVDDLSHRLLLEQSMSTEAKEVEVFVDVGDAPKLVIHVIDVIEMQLHLYSKYGCLLISWMAFEARKCRKQYYDSKFFLLFVGFYYSFAEVFCY